MTDSEAASEFDAAGFAPDGRQALMKMRIVGDVAGTSNALPSVDDAHVTHFAKAGALEPPYDPRVLMVLYENSNSLTQNVDAYKTNIDGHGHRFEPILDLNTDDTFDRVRTAMMLELEERALAEGEEAPTSPDAGTDNEDDPEASETREVQVPTDAEVEERIETIRQEMAMEKLRLTHWFDHVSDDVSFVELRRRKRSDLEITGNAYWEVLRDGAQRPSRITYLPAHTMRLLPADQQFTETQVRVPTASMMATRSVDVKKRFRRFVQLHMGSCVYFKEYGDPRTISANTGKVYEDFKAMEKAEGGEGKTVVEASEVMHHRVHSPRSAYGVPRWVGNMLAVLGNRQAEEVNFLYFENKSIPPLAVLVSGGRLTDDTVLRLKSYVENEIKGKKNFHNILILEAEGDSTGQLVENSGRMRIEIKPLTDAQQKDGLFLEYDERNMDKVGQSFRLPRLLRGDVRDFNRATADAALEFVEDQVFAPERNEFDHMINRTLMRELGVRWFRFRSNGPTRTNPVDLVEMAERLTSILPQNQLVKIVEEAFGKNFPDSAEEWTKLPPDMFMQGLRQGGQPDAAPPGAPDVGLRDNSNGADPAQSLAQVLIAARDQLAAQEQAKATEHMRARVEEAAQDVGEDDL